MRARIDDPRSLVTGTECKFYGYGERHRLTAEHDAERMNTSTGAIVHLVDIAPVDADEDLDWGIFLVPDVHWEGVLGRADDRGLTCVTWLTIGMDDTSRMDV